MFGARWPFVSDLGKLSFSRHGIPPPETLNKNTIKGDFMTAKAEWLREWFSRKSDVSRYSDEDWHACDFFIEGLVDSLEVIELVAAVEGHFGLQFNEDHFQDRRFTTIGGLCEIIREIQGTPAS
jgi:D-alanine--poly(phosphoribitol) ligase subunit 2